MSVGERSTIHGEVRNVTNSYVAVAVKDGSKANIRLENIKTHGPVGMTYIKKPFLGGDTEATFNSTSIDLSQFKAAPNTKLLLNNLKVNTNYFDVQDMYSSGPMKKFQIK